jgi:predicted alpha-1,2-mannosidase
MAYVDPFIGSAGDHGQLSPAATLPFGMVKLGPETDPGNHSGYDYNSKKIRGFTHNRIEGTGCNGAGGNILIQPGLGEPTTSAAVYDKNTEKVEPGYYSVVMQGIKAELTATNAAGFHRYTFPKSDNAYLLIDLASSFTALLEEHHTVHAKKEISGSVKAKNVCNFGSYQFYYTIYINKNIDSVIESGHRVYLLFSTQKDEEVTLQVSLSPVSVEQARKDGQTQLARFSFDQIRQQAREKWTQVLEKVQVSGDETYKKIFYTHLYHSYLAPFNLTSADGIYKSSNGKIYAAKDYTYYYSWAIWDNFRTQLPLLTVLEPTVSRDMAKSLVSLYEQGKHDWPVDTEPYISVRTEHAIIVLLDYYKKGLLDVNHLQKAYKALKEEARGFPFSGHGGNKAPSLDSYLEMSYDEWGIAQLAKALKQDKDYAYYLNKSARYKKIWEEHFKIMGDSADIIEAKGLYEGTYGSTGGLCRTM